MKLNLNSKQTRLAIVRSIARSSYREFAKRHSFAQFVKEHWECVPGAGTIVWSRHLKIYCREMQKVAWRVWTSRQNKYDLVFNVPPGTSKSTVISILFQAWVWTFFPQARFISATHTHTLVTDLSSKMLSVIRSEKYKQNYPEVVVGEAGATAPLALDKTTTEYFTNTLGGDRLTCTVGGKTPTGFHAHFLLCLPYESRIITSMGVFPIGQVVESKLPVQVLGWDIQTSQYRWQSVEAYESNPGRPLSRARFSDGSELEATDDHPVFVVGKGYVPIGLLSYGDEVIHALSVPELRSDEKSLPGSCKEDEDGMGFLFDAVSSALHERQKSSKVQQCRTGMQEVRQEDFGGIEEAGDQLLLQQDVSRFGSSGRKKCTLQKTIPQALSNLWQENNSRRETFRESNVFSILCGQNAIETNDWNQESQLYSRNGVRSVSVQTSEAQRIDSGTRWTSVRDLFQEREKESESVGSTPCGLGQTEQRPVQHGKSVHNLPSKSSRWSGEAEKANVCYVVSVERNVRISDTVYNVKTKEDHNYFAEGILVHNCDDPIDPQGARSEAELENARKFMIEVLPTRKVDKEVSCTILIMQRLHYRDPTAVMLEVAKNEAATPVRRICLPGELEKLGGDGAYSFEDVYPPGLAVIYKNGLLDPKRLSPRVLADYRVRLGAYGYACQILQKPIPPGGGMFKVEYFNNRTKAAPYNAQRIRYWDRASSQGEGAAYTAGVLMARDSDNKFYVEHVVHGQWEPDQRNQIMRATALKDRLRYGPKYAPKIYVEAEGGSSGRDAWLGVMRALAGFPVYEDKVTGSKDTRAEPWSCELAAKNVWMIDDGTWDLEGYIEEHLLFKPEATVKRLGKWKDMVDASSGSYNIFTGSGFVSPLRTFSIGSGKKKIPLRIVVCTKDELANTIIEAKTILIEFVDPPVAGEADEPPPMHGIEKLVATVRIPCLDIQPSEYQEQWEDNVAPYDKPAGSLIFLPDHGKKLWATLLDRKRNPEYEVVVIMDRGDRRALSTAYGICDVFHYPRKIIFVAGESSNSKERGKDDVPPNAHVFEAVKASRHLVAV